MDVKTILFTEALEKIPLPELDRNLFSSPAWLKVIYHTYGTKLFVKCIYRENKVSSYIIYSVVKNFLEWKVCICSYCDYCDSYISDPKDWDIFFKDLRREYPQYRITIRNLRDQAALRNSNFNLLSKERFHFLDVQAPIESIWKKTHDSFRSAVKQSQKKGVVVRRGTKKDLKTFYKFHLNLRKNKYRVFPQPYRFFEKIWDQYMENDEGILLGAFDPEDNFIGGNIYLICGDTLYYKFNTSGLSALQYRPNNLLFWEGIKFAKERGLKYIDLGSSGFDQSGLILFKNHTGAKMMDIHHLGFAPDDYKYSRKLILRLFTRICTHPLSPDAVVRWGSGIIYPYLA